ncbi:MULTISPECIES: substrate-binding domain-containing protein [Pseudonocardia]|uniref:Aliphatic amidase expression-regulating protein n=2 Tax=Pseudonocardia TaxID=1847 RepID=A0A1Y2MZV1_PSEAH|nr:MULTISPECIES: substrate-binding domain-containing protein [Pseudonocardia]OSY40733.1 Aliphatic amidase expression-regulating protein [Pseudonocardia autotrophica]TDN71960.1 amino acid/amide ABC transporter substrate-binding protein (HAAT family) [Pseudonocardia autotrophica]BBG02647.1 hypothetical protein Pdca_38560 [Pseudonocardia autotrophica]GEC24706.1 hypothetical protein PSA01_17350 [Pseudonocardia saturnea]
MAPDRLRVGLVVPLQGPAGMYGPSCELCAELAVRQLNSGSGILGREVCTVPIDGAAAPRAVAAEIDSLISARRIDAVVGWHISAVREAVVPAVAGRVPYVFTALYEGGEHRPGVFLTGETPDAQVCPAIAWMARELGVRRWTVVGNDYSWPRGSVRASRAYARASGATLDEEFYVPLGTDDFTPVLRRLTRRADGGILMFLVGSDAVRFNRQFAEAGLQDLPRLAPLMDENMLLASEPAGTRGLFTAAGFFESLVTPESLTFGGDFTRAFGPDAPTLNSAGESCYEGILLLAALLDAAGSTDVGRIHAHAEDVRYTGPRGELVVRGGHVRQPVYLAAPGPDDLEILATL